MLAEANALEILTKVETYYQNAFVNLVAVLVIGLAIVGIVVPLIVHSLQKASFRETAEKLREEMQRVTKNAKTDLEETAESLDQAIAATAAEIFQEFAQRPQAGYGNPTDARNVRDAVRSARFYAAAEEHISSDEMLDFAGHLIERFSLRAGSTGSDEAIANIEHFKMLLRMKAVSGDHMVRLEQLRSQLTEKAQSAEQSQEEPEE